MTEKKKRLAIIASKGTMDMAYPPLIWRPRPFPWTWRPGSSSRSTAWTSYKNKYRSLKVPPIANPAMPVPIPNIMGMLPGMTAMAAMMMKSWMGKQKVPTIPELLDICREGGVRLFGLPDDAGRDGRQKDRSRPPASKSAARRRSSSTRWTRTSPCLFRPFLPRSGSSPGSRTVSPEKNSGNSREVWYSYRPQTGFGRVSSTFLHRRPCMKRRIGGVWFCSWGSRSQARRRCDERRQHDRRGRQE